jgi:hypothetical protein
MGGENARIFERNCDKGRVNGGGLNFMEFLRKGTKSA